MEKASWKLHQNIKMDESLAVEVAKIACALQSLSVYTAQALEEDDTPESLRKIVDDGTEAMKRIFVW